MSENPYAPPNQSSDSSDESKIASAAIEATRREYVSAEESVRFVGLLYGVGALHVVGRSIYQDVIHHSVETTGFSSPLYLILAVVMGVIGVGIYRIQSWARVGVTILSILNLTILPVLLIILAWKSTNLVGLLMYLLAVTVVLNTLVLDSLWNNSTRRIFDPDYAGIIAATPGIRPSFLKVIWKLLMAYILAVAAPILRL